MSDDDTTAHHGAGPPPPDAAATPPRPATTPGPDWYHQPQTQPQPHTPPADRSTQPPPPSSPPQASPPQDSPPQASPPAYQQDSAPTIQYAAPQSSQHTGPPPDQQPGPAPDVAPPATASPPATAASPPGPDLAMHLRRIRNWRIQRAEISHAEWATLQQEGISDPTIARYLVWRRSMLLASLPIISLTAVFAVVGLVGLEDGSAETQLSNLVLRLPYFAPLVLTIGVGLALVNWAKARTSTRLLTISWALSFFLPVVPAVIPLQFLIDEDQLVFELGGDAQTAAGLILVLKISLGIQYAMQLLPTVITFPAGAVRGALRIRGMLPASSLTGWMLVVAAPFYSLIVLVALVLVTQLLGTGLLLVGTVLLVFGPWLHVRNRRLYTGVATEESERELDRTQLVTGLVALAGAVVILIWALTAKVSGIRPIGSGDEAQLDYVDAARLAAESIARVIVTTVVFAGVLLRMTITNWRNDRIRRADGGGDAIDAQFAQIEQAIERTVPEA